MKGYKAIVIVLHCVAAVCTLVVIGTAGALLAGIAKYTKTTTNSSYTSSYDSAVVACLGFLMFVAVTGLIWNIVAIVANSVPSVYQGLAGCLFRQHPERLLIPEFIMTMVWTMFWLAAAGAAAAHSSAYKTIFCITADLLSAANSWGLESNAAGQECKAFCNEIKASIAFAWIAWTVWSTLAILVAAMLSQNLKAAREARANARMGQMKTVSELGPQAYAMPGQNGLVVMPCQNGNWPPATMYAMHPGHTPAQMPALVPEQMLAEMPGQMTQAGQVPMQCDRV